MDVKEHWSVASTTLSSYESGFVRGVLYHRHSGADATVEQFLSALEFYELYCQFCQAHDVDPAAAEDPDDGEGLSPAESGFRDALVFIRYGIVHAAGESGTELEPVAYEPESASASLH